MRRYLIAVAVAALSVAAVAQGPAGAPGAPDATRVKAGTYKADPNHTQVQWQINHLGFTFFRGFFAESSGTLTLDPAHPAAAKVNITVPLSKIVTTSGALNDHLRTPDFFDATKYPTATFTSTRVVPSGKTATIYGNLDLHGVSKPVVLHARFIGAGTNPMSKASTVGFEATGTIRRSEWGIKDYLPALSDQVDLWITASFDRQG